MKFEKISSNRVKFTFTVTEHEFEHALEHAFHHIKDDVEIKGFRKGHVTRAIYEKKFGANALYPDALNHAIGHKFDDALAIKEFTIVSDPNNIDFDWEKVGKGEFDITFEVAIKPEVTLGDYKGLEVAKVNTEVTDAEVDAEINALLKQGANLEPKAEGSLAMGDTAIFDFEGFLDGVPFEGGKAENFSLEIGSGQFIPGFEEGMVGLNVGEERDVNVTFPEQYGAEHLAGKPAVFKVKLHEIKVTVGAELNDAFVASLNREGVATVAELKASIAADLKKNKDLEAKNQITEEVVEKVVANASVDVPQEMFDQEVANFKKNVENQAKQYQLDLNTYLQLSGLTAEAFEAQAQEQARRRVLQSLVIEAVAKKEGFGATADELVARYEELSKLYKMPVENIKQYISDDLVTNDIAFEKALNFLVETAVQK